MLSRSIIRETKRIELVTRRLVNEQIAGHYSSVFKGRGMDFNEVRQYQPGDDIRLIDWNVTARIGEPFIKQFVEERELTVFLLVDASSSLRFGSTNRTKTELAARVAALFGLSAIRNNDRVGLALFTDRVERFVPPKKGRAHVLRVITEVISHQPTGTGTDLAGALEFLGRLSKRRSVAIVISDFDGSGFERALDLANRRHDLVCVQVNDPLEERLPDLGPWGYMEVEDPESGELVPVDPHPRFRAEYEQDFQRRSQKLQETFRRLKIDSVRLRTDRPFAQPLVNLFRRRAGMSRRRYGQ